MSSPAPDGTGRTPAGGRRPLARAPRRHIRFPIVVSR